MKMTNRFSQIAAATLALTLAANAGAQNPDSGKEAPLSAVEQQYLQTVVKENFGEVAIGYLALEKATSDDVKRHARDLINTHTKTMQEIMEMASRHNAYIPLAVDMSSYQKLQASGGAEFDKFYAAEAQRLNQSAIDTLDPLLSQFSSDDVKKFAQEDLKDDREHLKSAQDLAAKLKG